MIIMSPEYVGSCLAAGTAAKVGTVVELRAFGADETHSNAAAGTKHGLMATLYQIAMLIQHFHMTFCFGVFYPKTEHRFVQDHQ